MKKILGLIVSIVIILGISFYGRTGNTKNVERNIGDSTRYTSEEVNAAMDVVVSKFKWTFKDCTLKNIRYEEVNVQKEEKAAAKKYGADEAIVLYTDFETGEDSWEEGFNPSSTYTDWGWCLVRSNKGRWKLKGWGY